MGKYILDCCFPDRLTKPLSIQSKFSSVFSFLIEQSALPLLSYFIKVLNIAWRKKR